MRLDLSSPESFIESAARAKKQHKSLLDRQALLKDKELILHRSISQWAEANSEVKHMVEAIQHSTYGRVEELVTYALQYVFGNDMSCSIVTKQTAHGVSAEVLVNKGEASLDPLTSCGGGVVDVVSFALRLAAIMGDASRGTRRRILILDEPFRFLSADYKPAMAALVEELSDKYNFQIIMVTHDDEFVCGKVHRIG